MSTLRFARDVVTVWRVPYVEVRSRWVWDYEHAEPERDVKRCQVDPLPGAEQMDRRDSEASVWLVKAPPTADIADNDRIKYRGDTYRIVGSVQHQASPRGRLDHLMFTMERWKG